MEFNAKDISMPSSHSKVYKTEGMISFDSPASKDGLFVNLKTWQAFGKSDLELLPSSYPPWYLVLSQVKIPKEKDEKSMEVAPVKLALGKEGGFSGGDSDDFTTEEKSAIYHRPSNTFTDITSAVPEIQEVAAAILQHSGQAVQDEVAAWEEELKTSRYADSLVQLDTAGRSIAPSGWKCEACGSTENLWLNLSDGFIGCGRKNWDGTGGCGEALTHYEATGSQYPLAVKLGTITPEGADVFSYATDENDMVKNPKLAAHLLHWGINLESMKKTEKSMNELQIDLNMNYEFDKITEAGASLVPRTGAGYIGIKNLGNSCYMNSVVQVLLSLPELQQVYLQNAESIFKNAIASNVDFASDFNVQFAKMAVALLTSRYDILDAAKHRYEIKPLMFRRLVGKGHSEFSTARQQDAAEYFQHIVEVMHRSERSMSTSSTSSKDLFDFHFEDRIECSESHKVKYVTRKDCLLQLVIPFDEKEQEENEAKRLKVVESTSAPPIIPFESCLDQAFGTETVKDFYSTSISKKTNASRRVLFKTFPKYLVVQMRRYYVSKDWTPKKLDVRVPVPETLDLEAFRGCGIADGEEELPTESEESSASAGIVPDETLVAQLISMGFSENGCKRAAIATSNSNAEAAMEWIFAHMEDPDFNDPPVAVAAAAAGTPSSLNPEHVSMLVAMGFTPGHAEAALKATDGAPDRAADWLFSHGDDLDGAIAALSSNSTSSTTNNISPQDLESKGQYSLHAIISHMGSNTGCGHYVCHIKKEGKWVIFNDEKVAESESPPFDLGYLYIFKRND